MSAPEWLIVRPCFDLAKDDAVREKVEATLKKNLACMHAFRKFIVRLVVDQTIEILGRSPE